MAAFGFESGLPYMLSSLTLEQWLTEHRVSLAMIGSVALIGLAYTLKFLWAPVFDGVRPPVFAAFGRRRGWLLLVQPALVASIVALALSDPGRALAWTMAAAVCVAFFSACQDILIDAWRIESFDERALGFATACWIWGYRVAMLASGSGALWAAGRVGWHGALLGVAGLAAVGPVVTLAAKEPSEPPASPQPNRLSLRNAGLGPQAPVGSRGRAPGLLPFLEKTVLAPFAALLTRPAAIETLVFIVSWRLGEAVALRMATPFYRSLGFDRAAVAATNFLPALIATLAGTAFGGWLVSRFGTWRALLLSGIASLVTMTLYLALAWSGAILPLLYAKVSLQAFTEGMAQAAMVTFLSSLCDRVHTASQYALLSSFAAFALHTLGGGSGLLAGRLGWVGFYGLTTGLCVVPILLVLHLGRGVVKHGSRA